MEKMHSIDINRYWARVIDTMNDALMIISQDGTILSVNRSFEELSGYASEDIVGQPCTTLRCDACERAFLPETREWCTLFQPENPGIRRCRCEIERKDGTMVKVLKNASVLCDEAGNQIGAVETLTDISEIERLDREVALLHRQLDHVEGFHGIIGRSAEMQEVFTVIEKSARSRAPVLIMGESGTGKELVASAIHRLGNRSTGPYLQVNCAALNDSLLESELFGHVKGSFTGAYRDRKGRFESATGGDLFLDEIGDLPRSIQIKLLRVLETNRFDRVGEDHPVDVDVRIITATHKNLLQLIEEGAFREDLYFRINVLPIHLPPLRKRGEDLLLLINAFMQRLRQRTGKQIEGIERTTLDLLMSYSWPGNVRELQSVLEYGFTIADKGLLRRHHLPRQFGQPVSRLHHPPRRSAPRRKRRRKKSC
jgi:two-component system response regulator HydG